MEELKQRFADSPNYQRLPNMERVRMITIEGCRPIACGGTHLRNVSEARETGVEKAENMGEASESTMTRSKPESTLIGGCPSS